MKTAPKAKPLHSFTHPDTTQEEKLDIFIQRSFEFANVKNKTDAIELGAAFKAFERRMKSERKTHLQTTPRIGDTNPALKKLRSQLRG